MFIQNREFFTLTNNEKMLRDLLRVLAMLIFAVIVKGIFNQNSEVNQDAFLVPSMATLSQLFCVLYAYNAFTTGNLARRWANAALFAVLFNGIQSLFKTDDERTLVLATRAFGVFIIGAMLLTVLWELNFYFWKKNA